KQYGLNSTTLVDDRYDPLKATDAACRHLRDLYNQFGDWFLALAAYNSGAGNVNKAIRRAGGIKNYWAIWPYLPRETRGYVPAFIAVNYVMNYAPEHNICPLDPGIIKNGTDTVTVHDVLHFDQLNEMLGVPMADLKFFNPQYKAEIIPATSKKPCLLTLPEQYVGPYIDNEKELYTFKTKSGIDKEKLQERIKSVSDRSVHIVKKGETLSTIARKYHVSVNQLKQWNNMKSDRLSIGQKLVVYSSGAPMAQAGNDKPVERSTTQITHTVKKGETLGKIAQKYKCSVTDLKRWNNLKSTNIQVGQKLKVYPPENQNVSSGNNNNKPASSSSGTTTYTVKSGDSLWSIAKKFNVTVDHIKKLNNLKNNDIKVGQKLKI
ncbi:MAG: LysM peptidoglycan-binding domain-containing protein, partial [Bacteroidales bacterium]|nr:LysM peptidoglycan-binding domain-containing protein [Bacteroidales bacterium]